MLSITTNMPFSMHQSTTFTKKHIALAEKQETYKTIESGLEGLG